MQEGGVFSVATCESHFPVYHCEHARVTEHHVMCSVVVEPLPSLVPGSLE